jgi:hypothetical protein
VAVIHLGIWAGSLAYTPVDLGIYRAGYIQLPNEDLGSNPRMHAGLINNPFGIHLLLLDDFSIFQVKVVPNDYPGLHFEGKKAKSTARRKLESCRLDSGAICKKRKKVLTPYRIQR